MSGEVKVIPALSVKAQFEEIGQRPVRIVSDDRRWKIQGTLLSSPIQEHYWLVCNSHGTSVRFHIHDVLYTSTDGSYFLIVLQ